MGKYFNAAFNYDVGADNRIRAYFYVIANFAPSSIIAVGWIFDIIIFYSLSIIIAEKIASETTLSPTVALPLNL